MSWRRPASVALLILATAATMARAQEPKAQTAASGGQVTLTLKRSIELALQNSKDIQLAKLQVQVATQTANVTRSEFLPNLYAGSGAGYTYGLPETPGGRPPSIFSITYSEQVFNGPLKGLQKEQQEAAKAQTILLQETRNTVMARVATSYLELLKVRHSLELLRKERDSAQKIVELTQERQQEGFELPLEVTKAQLTKAQVVQKILQLENRQDELEVILRSQLGLPQEQALELTAEELPGSAEQEGANLVAMSMESSPSIAFAETDVKAKEFRLKGEKQGYLPSLQLVSIYSLLAKYNFNNYANITNSFQYNNLNAGINVNVPIYSTKTRASVALAQANLEAAQINLANKKTQVNADVRQRSRKVQLADASREVSRLELQIAQQNVAQLQSQFGEGKASLRDVEKARLDENEKWMAYLDANFQKQQAQVELLRSAGQLEKVLE